MTWGEGFAGPLNCDLCFGTLTIGAVSMHTPAWCITDLSDLWSSPTLRGANRLIPGRQGRKAYKRRLDENKLQFPMLVTGYCDPEGFPYGDMGMTPDQGLEANIAYLQNNVVLPNDDQADSTREATFTLPSGNTRVSTIQVVSLTGRLAAGALFRGTLEITDVDALLLVGGDIVV